MRFLFYTATTVILVLAGIFTFYALRAPDRSIGTKVVLSVDTDEAPVAQRPGALAESDRALIAEVESQLKRRPSANAGAEPATGRPNGAGGTASSESATPEPSATRDSPPAEHAAPASEPDRIAALGSPSPQPEADAAISLPGTTLEGLGNDGAFQPRATPRKPSPAVNAQDDQPIKPVAKPAPSEPYTLSGTQLSVATPEGRDGLRETLTTQTPPAGARKPAIRDNPAQTQETGANDERGAGAAASAPPANDPQRSKPDAVLATLNENEAPQADPSIPPPPFPLRRPDKIPPASRTAALNGWVGTHFTTTEVALPRQAKVAILIRGVGRDDQNSNEAVTKLPAAISLAFMPYSGGAQQWAAKARELGHEVIVQLPLEPSDYPLNNPGPETLLASASPDDNVSRMRTILSRFDGYSGVTNLLGGKILQSKSALRPILENLKAQGLIYVGEGNESHAIVKSLAGEMGLRYGNADLIIDVQPSPQGVKKALQQLAALAKKDGSAIGLGFASRTTIDQIEAWSRTLAAEGVTLVPVGVLAHAPGA